MRDGAPSVRPDLLAAFFVAYAAASFFHFSHNAEFLRDYPNMPPTLTRAKVYEAWLAISAVGVTGWVLLGRGFRLLGLGAIAVYGLLGIAGLDHYALASPSAHTATMNLTIGLEVATGIALAGLVASGALRAAR